MERYHVSDYWNKGLKGHSNYNFIDVAVNDDNLLFIDPVLLRTSHDDWSKASNTIVDSFFDSLCEAYRNNEDKKKIMLLSHAREQNATRFGYGRGDNGKGNTADGLLHIFAPLGQLSKEIITIKNPEDLSVLIENFAEDGLSDLLTNILHEQLNKFTLLQINKYGIKSNSLLAFWTWDIKGNCWKKVECCSYCVDGQELLLVPKHIVRKRYLFSTSQYFYRIILERIRQEGGYMEDGKPISKSDIVKSKRHSKEHWQYDEVISYTKQHNDVLSEYHRKLPVFYAERGHSMKDEALDELIYKGAVSQIM